MGSCAFLSAGASHCGRGAGPLLDVLRGETPFRAATASENEVELCEQSSLTLSLASVAAYRAVKDPPVIWGGGARKMQDIIFMHI